MHQAAAEGVETPGPWSGLGSEGGKKSLEVGGGKRRGGKEVLTSASRQKVNCASSQRQPVLPPPPDLAVGADSSRHPAG